MSLGDKPSCLFFFSQLHMGKQAEEQQKFGERVSGLWLREAVKACSRLSRLCLYSILEVVLCSTLVPSPSSPPMCQVVITLL